MNLYQKINDPYTLNVIVTLIRNGIYNSKVITHINIYERFYQLTESIQERYEILSKEYNLSPRTIRRIITTLNQKAK